MASDVAEAIVSMVEKHDAKKQFIVAQMSYDKYAPKGQSSPCRIGSHKETTLENLLNNGWRIETQFQVTKVMELEAPYVTTRGHEHPDWGKHVLVAVQHFIMSKHVGSHVVDSKN